MKNFVDSGMGSVLCLLVWIPGFIMLRLRKVSVQSLQHWCSLDVVLQIIKSLIKLIVLIAAVYILLKPKAYHFEYIPRSFPIPILNTLGSFVFELYCGQTNRQTDRQTVSNVLPTPIDIFGVGNNWSISAWSSSEQLRATEHHWRQFCSWSRQRCDRLYTVLNSSC